MSDKERDLILFLNKKLDCLYHSNDKLKDANNNCKESDLSVRLTNCYLVGYDNAIKDFKRVLLNLLKGESVNYDEKKSS